MRGCLTILVATAIVCTGLWPPEDDQTESHEAQSQVLAQADAALGVLRVSPRPPRADELVRHFLGIPCPGCDKPTQLFAAATEPRIAYDGARATLQAIHVRLQV